MTRRRLPPLNAVRAFEAAARLGSYVAAADELHVTQPAVGRHVKSLEADLSCVLFERTPRGVVLTEDGRRYYTQIQQAIELIADASDELSSRRKTIRLRVMAVPGFASRFLSPLLVDFREQFPRIRIALEANASFDEIEPRDADIGIVYGETNEFHGHLEELCRPQVFPVCAPAFLKKHGPFLHVKDLLHALLLHEDDGSWWNTWFRAVGVKGKTVSELSYASAEQVINLAIAGKGIALSNSVMSKHELESGELLRPVSQHCVLDAYWLITPKRALSAEAKAFRQWLAAQLRAL
jgi:LysR family glycine cleavage system transcriptional activator